MHSGYGKIRVLAPSCPARSIACSGVFRTGGFFQGRIRRAVIHGLVLWRSEYGFCICEAGEVGASLDGIHVLYNTMRVYLRLLVLHMHDCQARACINSVGSAYNTCILVIGQLHAFGVLSRLDSSETTVAYHFRLLQTKGVTGSM